MEERRAGAQEYNFILVSFVFIYTEGLWMNDIEPGTQSEQGSTSSCWGGERCSQRQGPQGHSENWAFTPGQEGALEGFREQSEGT